MYENIGTPYPLEFSSIDRWKHSIISVHGRAQIAGALILMVATFLNRSVESKSFSIIHPLPTFRPEASTPLTDYQLIPL